MKKLANLHPFIGSLHAASAELNYDGAAFLAALNELDPEAYRDVRSRLDVANFDPALKTVDRFLYQVRAAFGCEGLPLRM
jgi:hypothetical protein